MPTFLTLALAASPLAAQDVLGDPVVISRDLGIIQTVVPGDFGGPLPGLLVQGAGGAVVLSSPVLNGADRTAAISGMSTAVLASAACDLDGDGVDEVLIQSAATGGAAWQWFASVGGGAAFELAGASSATVPVVRALGADLDGDGDEDVVGETADGLLVWFEADAGQLVPIAGPVPGGPSPGRTILGWRVLDVDGDGLDDVIVEEGPTPALLVIPSVGSGSFGAPVTVAQLSNSLPASSAFIDDDGDGDLDALVLLGPSVLRAENLGGFSFAPPASVATGSGAARPNEILGTADVDGDGDQDLVLRSGSFPMTGFGPAYSSNLGGGAWGQVTTQNAPEYESGLIVDLDGDGLSEFVEALSRVTLRRAQAGIGLTTLDDPIEITPPPTVSSAVFADADGDGDLDIVGAAGSPTSSVRRLDLLLNDGTSKAFERVGSFGPDAVFAQLRSGDLDGDGDDDIVATTVGQGTLVFLSSGGQLAVAQAQPIEPGSVNLFSLRLVDVDDDGDLDLAYALVDQLAPQRLIVQLNDGQATAWTRRDIAEVSVDSFGGEPSQRFAFGDFDGDGVTDLLAARFVIGAPATWFLPGLGGGQFGPRQLAQPDRIMGWLVDVDGDGLDDMITDEAEPQVALRIPGSPTFSSATTPLTAWIPELLRPRAIDDLDGDGRDDIIGFLNDVSLPGRWRVHLGLPGGGFGPRADSVPQVSFANGDLADVDDDGDLDLLIRTSLQSIPRLEIHFGLAREQVGSSTCGPAAINSTGSSARMLAYGEASPTSSDLEIRAIGLPQRVHGMFLASMTVTAPAPVFGSAGSLCLGGAVGRYDGPGQIQSSGPGGSLRLAIDPASIAQPGGAVAAQAGQTWSFQAWFRDVQNGAATSNFSDALSIDF